MLLMDYSKIIAAAAQNDTFVTKPDIDIIEHVVEEVYEEDSFIPDPEDEFMHNNADTIYDTYMQICDTYNHGGFLNTSTSVLFTELLLTHVAYVEKPLDDATDADNCSDLE